MTDRKLADLSVCTIKGLAMDAVEKAQSGHPGTPMGLATIAYELFANVMRHDPADADWQGRDRFVLSAGHASMLLYSMLHLAGYGLTKGDLEDFRQWGSKTPGHPEHGHTKGVEITTGPLGSGVSSAVGMALGLKMKAARFGAPLDDLRVWVIASDGDVMEGVSGEASSLAGHLGLDNLVVVWDDNRITIEGETELAFSEDVGKRYEAYGFKVRHVDGHDHDAVRAALEACRAEQGAPHFIVARTHIAHGAPKAVDTSEAHGAPLGKDEIAATKKAMGFDPDAAFVVPAEVRAHFDAKKASLGDARRAWDAAYAAWSKANAEKARAYEAFESRAVPADLYAKLLAKLPSKDDATRGHSGALQQVVGELVPSLVGGSADLGPSTKTLFKGSPSVKKGDYAGRNLHFGIREHGMGAIVNGLALAGGHLPFGSTFLVFSDYMRGSVRLSALMNLPTTWIYTHDSIFLGEDGPTHQPVEHLWALRSIPNLFVVRPADALECAAAWAIAIGRTDGPTAFALSRQKVPSLTRDPGFAPDDALRGAYVLQDAPGGAPDLVIVATGSEVGLAVAAKTALEQKGRKVRVVSAPCLEAFAQQDAGYRNDVLPRGVRKVSIEAGRTFGWKGLVGEDGLTIGVDGFGASAPDKVLAKEYGLVPEAVVAKIEAWLGGR